jgi:hypothetical protein
MFSIACPSDLVLPALDDSVSCHLPKQCTGVECCVDVDLVGRSFHAYVQIDPCQYTLGIGIENLVVNLTLLDYEWGKVEQFNMGRVVRIE